MVNMYNEFLQAVMSGEKSPCTMCPHYNACATDELACEAFKEHIINHTGCWQLKNRRNPTHEIYLKVFKEEEVENA